jgi:hypothetical protein
MTAQSYFIVVCRSLWSECRQVASVLGDDDKPGLLHKLQKNVCMVLALFSSKYDEEFAEYLQGFVHGEGVV